MDKEESGKVLVDLSEFLENSAAEPSPTFLLDSIRQLGKPEPNTYDNRWITFPQGFHRVNCLFRKALISASY